MLVQGDGWPVFLLSPGSPIRHLSPPSGTTPHKQTRSVTKASDQLITSRIDHRRIANVSGGIKRDLHRRAAAAIRVAAPLYRVDALTSRARISSIAPHQSRGFQDTRGAKGVGIGGFFLIFNFFLLKLTAIANNLLLLLLYICLLLLILFYRLMNVELKMPHARKPVVDVSIYFDNSVLCHKSQWL